MCLSRATPPFSGRKARHNRPIQRARRLEPLLARGGFDGRAAQLAKPNKARNLVKRLTRGIIDRAASSELIRRAYPEKLAMAAGYKKHEIGKGHTMVSRGVAKMIDAVKGTSGCQGFRGHHPRQDPLNRPGPQVAVNIGKRRFCGTERITNDQIELFGMRALRLHRWGRPYR